LKRKQTGSCVWHYFDKSNRLSHRLNILTAAVEERRKNGDDLGDLGRNKEISPDEEERIKKYIKMHDSNCQTDLVSTFA